MGSCAKGRAWINGDTELILMLLWDFLPGRFDQDIADRKGVEKFLPVGHPVLVFRLGLLNRKASRFHKEPDLLKGLPDLFQYLIMVQKRAAHMRGVPSVKSGLGCLTVSRQIKTDPG